MQVSTRLSYPESGYPRSRPLAPRPWTNAPVSPITPDERGSGYRGTLARGSHQQVNDRITGGSADKEVFVARSLSSTLAMLQMNVVPGESLSETLKSQPVDDAEGIAFVEAFFSGVFSSGTSQ